MIYHYTKAIHLPSILAHSLQPTDALIAPGELPVLWFTTNERWENTVLSVCAPSLTAAHEAMLPYGGLARIVCHKEVALYRWKELKEIARIPSKIAMGLYSSAIRLGSRPGEWRGTLDAVPVAKFMAIDLYDGEKWISTSNLQTKAA